MIRKSVPLAAAFAVLFLLTFDPNVSSAQEVSGERVACASEPGARTDCPANTSAGVVLTRSTGVAPCLLGKTWGYDDNSVWVSDGCSAEFLAGQLGSQGAITPTTEKEAPAYVPNAGFKLFDGEKGQIYMRLFTYVRYLDQSGLDPS
jgi:DUF3011 family protein